MSFLRRQTTNHLTSPLKNKAPQPYDRLSQLPRLIGLWPSEMQDYSAAGTARILALLRKALRLERSRGRSGHWTYDLNRHLALAESLKAERAHLREMDRAPIAPACTATSRGATRPGKILHLPAAMTEGRSRAVPDLSRNSPGANQPVFLLPVLAESSS